MRRRSSRSTSEALLETVAQVSSVGVADESAPCSPAILARFEAGKLVMAATDSYRLAVKETDLPGSTQELEAIIPARALTQN
jgi:DNA polymerase III sliding clamp (beta) subunit (PCNA family)